MRKGGWSTCFWQANSEMRLSWGETCQPDGGVYLAAQVKHPVGNGNS